jgi:hypothetical protein
MGIDLAELSDTYPTGADDESIGPRAITTVASARIYEEI